MPGWVDGRPHLWEIRLVDEELRATWAAAFRSSLRDLMEAGMDPGHFREHFPDLLKNDVDRSSFGRLLDMQERYLSKLE
ncbi:MAG: hypothetical protein HC793_04045, partial [Aquincola sp.]|nr:hypothetical protein [Aquincola sp.]